MPAISKIRFTNVIYENGAKRYNDEIFQFDGYNGALILENGGGKTVFIQTAIQAILPHEDVADRKIRESLSLEGSPCHIAIEWILNDKPRRYLVTAVTLFLSSGKLDSYKYVYEYGENDEESIENIPFTQNNIVTDRVRINDYYSQMKSKNMNARTFNAKSDYHKYIEENYKIIPAEWRSIVRINNDEGGVEGYFDSCKTTVQLVDKLLIPIIEDSMPGDSIKGFSDAFEEQRERFKKHKQLKETINEGNQLQVQIDKYMNIFSNYNNSDKEFIDEQKYAKSIYEYVEKEKIDIDGKILRIQADIETVSILRSNLKSRQKSYEVAVLREEATNSEQKFREIEKIYDEINDQYRSVCAKLDNLNIAKLRKRIKQAKETILSREKDIENLEREQDIKDINDSFKKNSSKLHGYYLKEEEQFKNKKIGFEAEYLEAKQDYENENKLFNQLLDKQKHIEGKMNTKDGIRSVIESSMEEILKEIVVVNENETMLIQRKAWSDRASEINKLISDNENESRNLGNEKETIKIELDNNRENLKVTEEERIRKKHEIKNIDKNNELLLIKLKEYSDGFNYTESIYGKQESIINYLERQFKNLNEEKEELLVGERISGRFKDDYKNMDYFTPDPLINELMSSWKNQFNYVETGAQYVKRVSKALELSKEEMLNKYSYWAMCIVVEDKSVEKLKDIIYKNIDKFTSPLLILGENQANRIIKSDKSIEEKFILPKHWNQNIDQEFFKTWKIEIEEKVNEITKERKQKENEIAIFSKLNGNVSEFFNNYPYEYYKKLKEDYTDLKQQNDKLNNIIKDKDARVNTIDSEIIRINNQNSEQREEYSTLDNWVKLTHKYINLERNKNDTNKEIASLKQDNKALDVDIKIMKRSLDRKAINIDKLTSEITSVEYNLKNLKNEELYKEVKDQPLEHTGESKHLLIEERSRLKDIINENSKDLDSLNKSIKDEKQRIIELEKSLKNEKRLSDYNIDEDLEFPLYGDEEIDRLLTDKEKLEPEKQEIQRELNEKEDIYKKDANTLEIKTYEYSQANIKIIEFNIPLIEVISNLDIEEKDINMKEKQNEKIKNSLDKQILEIEHSLQKLRIMDATHKYNSEFIKTIYLEEGFHTEFPYNRNKFIKDLSFKLEKLEDNRKQLKNNLENERQRYRDFCNIKLRDVRLREVSIGGINPKNEYEDALKWKQSMTTTINNMIKISEDDIRGFYSDLEKFIDNLVVHLREITNELREIPKKTRINIDGISKEIYKFIIPEWKEDDAKDEIAKYIDKMTEELDKEKFKNEDNTENNTIVRREVEKWLDPKQLLRVVLKDDTIKISCRKVSNDGKFISGLNSWESSNRWSGGEKWSKNTTLFLGILNYIAEKRGGIIAGLKTSRTVIMDNPFGKASSDHVLDPVFLIAEKLGFQIIALTAHAEGSFIRNYFPIVYSCRLRESVNGETLIIDAEKQIKHAFFKDKNPNTLNRIEDREQVSLFE